MSVKAFVVFTCDGKCLFMNVVRTAKTVADDPASDSAMEKRSIRMKAPNGFECV